ncbi:MAG: hypothetical protein HQK96_01695 [Nitrospirae bacterium]|nr:hypothetical protein [Nitrospirota bacterium]
MAKVTDKFASAYLSNKLIDALRALKEAKDAMDPAETEIIAKLDNAISIIVSIEV